MARNPAYEVPEFPAPDPTPVIVSASLFDTLATTLGASRVERDDEWAYVHYNGHEYKAALRHPVRDWLPGGAK